MSRGVNRRHRPVAEFFIRLATRKPLGVFGGGIFLILLCSGIFADLLAPYGMNEIHMLARLAPPSAEHVLGADQAGRDILTRLIYGARISMIVGLAGTTVTVVVAVIIGLPSGFLGGAYDIIVQRAVDAWLAFPGLLILLTVLSNLSLHCPGKLSDKESRGAVCGRSPYFRSVPG